MCGTGGNGTAADADDDVVPASALAAALIMIAAGIAIVASYGCGKIRAWRPEQTYVLNDANQPTAESNFEAIPLDNLDAEAAVLDAGVDGLDDGLSETLKTSLLPQEP